MMFCLGSLAITAWMFLAGFGITMARHYKGAFGRFCCGTAIWFQVCE